MADPRDSSIEDAYDDEDTAVGIDVVTALWAAGTTDELLVTDDVALSAEACVGVADMTEELPAAAEELLAPMITPAAVTVDEPTSAEDALDATDATVCKVVAALGGKTPAAAMLFVKDPAPHRQEQSHAPFERRVPVPCAIAPGDPTAGATAGRTSAYFLASQSWN